MPVDAAELTFANENDACEFARFQRMDQAGDTVAARIIDYNAQAWNHAPVRTHLPGAPMTREECIARLIANDRNGCYSDEDCIAEDLQPLTHAEALQLIATIDD
jgi:hypothetical protein